MLLIAEAAGGRWPDVVTGLIERDIADEKEIQADMTTRPRAVVLLGDLHALWPDTESFLSTEEIVRRPRRRGPVDGQLVELGNDRLATGVVGGDPVPHPDQTDDLQTRGRSGVGLEHALRDEQRLGRVGEPRQVHTGGTSRPTFIRCADSYLTRRPSLPMRGLSGLY